jgi:hypothetical protein
MGVSGRTVSAGRWTWAIPILLVPMSCGRTALTFSDDECAAGEVRRCDSRGGVGQQVCREGVWLACSPMGGVGTGGSGVGQGASHSGGSPGAAGVGGDAGVGGAAGAGEDGGAPNTCVPALENCLTPADEDCDGQTPACSSEFGLALPGDIVFGLSVAPNGGVALGLTGPSGNFGGAIGDLGNAGGRDAYLVFFDTEGQPVWGKRFGDEVDQEFHGIDFDADGALFATGDFQGTYTLAGDDFTGPASNVLAKFDASGDALWAKAFEYSNGRNVSAFPNGDVAVVGDLIWTTDFGGGARMPSDNDWDSYVAKFTADGEYAWDHHIQGGPAITRGVAVDSTGDTIIAGDFRSNVNLGQGVITSAGGIYIVRYDTAGTLVRAQVFEAYTSFPVAVAVDNQRNVVVAGTLHGDIHFGLGQHTASEGFFIVKFDVSGNTLWSRSYDPSTTPSGAGDVAFDSAGNVIFAGSFRGTLDTPTPLEAAADAVVIKFDADGNVVWTRTLGGEYAEAFVVDTDAAGRVFTAGRFHGQISYDTGMTYSSDDFDDPSDFDVFFARLDP